MSYSFNRRYPYIAKAEDIIDDEDQIQDNEGSEFRDEVFSTTQGRTEELSTLGCREISDSAPQPQNISDEHKKSTVCWHCGKSFDTRKKRPNIHFFKASLSRFYCLEDEYSRYFNV